jgi:hypothetical protein
VELSVRVARSRDLVAAGYPLSAVARAAPISRRALYRVPKPRTAPQRRPARDLVEATIVEEALANQTDGYRMVTAFVRRRLGLAVNRKRVLRVMRERNLIQRRRPLERRKRPGFFWIERPRQLWQLDMSNAWVPCPFQPSSVEASSGRSHRIVLEGSHAAPRRASDGCRVGAAGKRDEPRPRCAGRSRDSRPRVLE